MSYTQITAHVVDQTLHLTNLPDLASGGVGNILVKFDFCELWDGYGKTAVFYRNPADVYHITIVDNTAEVPHEVMPDKGYFFFGVMGAADNVRTTEVIRVEYKQGAITAATANHKEPTPDIYQQLLAAYGLLEARFNNMITAGTPKDGELADVRVDWEGETHESAGAAVRSQFAQALAAIVEYSTSTGFCNWKAYEIFELVRKGRRAVFRTNDMSYIPLTYVDQRVMRFEHVTTDDTGRTIRKAFIIDNDGILTCTGSTLATQEQLAEKAVIDDSKVGEDAWSSKKTSEEINAGLNSKANILIVDLSHDAKTASHNAKQIYDHVNGGGVAFLRVINEYLPMIVASPTEASFGNTRVAGEVVSTVEFVIDSSGNVATESASVGSGDADPDAPPIITPVELPQELNGSFYAIVEDGGKLFTGTHNVIDIMQLKQGTVEVNGVTVTVEGNTLTIKGTCTATTYLSLYTHVSSISECAKSGPEIPEQLYTLSLKHISGTAVYPKVAIRGRAGGNITVVQNNTAQYTHDYETCGHLYLLCDKGKEYDCTEVLALLPYATSISNTHREETSVVQTITESGVYELNGYTWSYGNASVGIQEGTLPSGCFCRYAQKSVAYTGATEILDVYTPQKVGYLLTRFGKCSKADDGTQIWRILYFQAMDASLTERFRITQNGETEMAVQIVGRDDFIGGWTHGDEIRIGDNFTVLLDGKVVDVTSLTEYTVFDELRIIEVTQMNDPADHTTQVGEHGKEYIVTKDGIEIGQSVKWMGAYELKASFMPMLCAIRGEDAVSDLQITDTYIDNGDFKKYDVSVGGFTGYPAKYKDGVSRFTLLSEKSGVTITLDILESTNKTGAASRIFPNVDTYNKIYYAICGATTNHTTQNGEKWRSRSKIKIEIGNGADV